MKIGFLISFFDFRNDVRIVINELTKTNEVAVFAKTEQVSIFKQHMPDGVECRTIREDTGSFKNRFAERMYLLFKKLPASRNNYYLMETFKSVNLKHKNL